VKKKLIADSASITYGSASHQPVIGMKGERRTDSFSREPSKKAARIIDRRYMARTQL